MTSRVKGSSTFCYKIPFGTTIIYGHCSKPDRDCPWNRQFPNNEFHSHGSTDAICELSATRPQSTHGFIVNDLYQAIFSSLVPRLLYLPLVSPRKKPCPWIYSRYINRWSSLKVLNNNSKENYLKPSLELPTNWQVPKQYQATVQVSKGRMFTFLLQTSFFASLPQVSFHTPVFVCCKCPLHCRLQVCSLIWGNMDVREVKELPPHLWSLITEHGVSKLVLCFQAPYKGIYQRSLCT